MFKAPLRRIKGGVGFPDVRHFGDSAGDCNFKEGLSFIMFAFIVLPLSVLIVCSYVQLYVISYVQLYIFAKESENKKNV
jgi:hypothetical protein